MNRYDINTTLYQTLYNIYIYILYYNNGLCWNMHRKPICRRYSFSQSFSRLENSCPVWLGESAMCFFWKYLLQSLVSFRWWMDVACDNDGFLLVHKNYEEMYIYVYAMYIVYICTQNYTLYLLRFWNIHGLTILQVQSIIMLEFMHIPTSAGISQISMSRWKSNNLFFQFFPTIIAVVF